MANHLRSKTAVITSVWYPVGSGWERPFGRNGGWVGGGWVVAGVTGNVSSENWDGKRPFGS